MPSMSLLDQVAPFVGLIGGVIGILAYFRVARYKLSDLKLQSDRAESEARRTLENLEHLLRTMLPKIDYCFSKGFVSSTMREGEIEKLASAEEDCEALRLELQKASEIDSIHLSKIEGRLRMIYRIEASSKSLTEIWVRKESEYRNN